MKNVETLTLRVPRQRKASLLKLLRELSFVEVETLEDKVKRFSKKSFPKPSLSEKEIVEEVLAVRYGKKQK